MEEGSDSEGEGWLIEAYAILLACTSGPVADSLVAVHWWVHFERGEPKQRGINSEGEWACD